MCTIFRVQGTTSNERRSHRLRLLWWPGVHLQVHQAASLVNPPADLVITGAEVYCGAPTGTWADAVAVRGDRIVAVGNEARCGTGSAPRSMPCTCRGGWSSPGSRTPTSTRRLRGVTGSPWHSTRSTAGRATSMRLRSMPPRTPTSRGSSVAVGPWSASPVADPPKTTSTPSFPTGRYSCSTAMCTAPGSTPRLWRSAASPGTHPTPQTAGSSAIPAPVRPPVRCTRAPHTHSTTTWSPPGPGRA